MRIVGLDLSLTATGIAVNDNQPWVLKTRLTGHDRLDWIRQNVMYAACDRHTTLVVVEGPSFGSQGSAYHQLAGLWWLIAHNLWMAKIPYAVVSPQARAKYATGKGNAGKDAVLSAVVRRFPGLDVNDNNVADAVVLMAMGCDQLGHPLVEMPAVNREALAKVDWPAFAQGSPDGPGGAETHRATCGVGVLAKDRASVLDSREGSDFDASADTTSPGRGGAS